MSRTPFVAGNWKMNTNKALAVDLAKGVAAGAPKGVEVGVVIDTRLCRCRQNGNAIA